jgi:hypothetical protein
VRDTKTARQQRKREEMKKQVKQIQETRVVTLDEQIETMKYALTLEWSKESRESLNAVFMTLIMMRTAQQQQQKQQ